ncbi:3-oxoacyl-[acyl-carrier-protein] synthase-3 [Alteromonadaceae bacterium 2753L.S.0a.02]|nr:3-oxoacyl-[acyl-carrier-protein] synthase-3 [Alteromonadaceae bacterium 2753L.S.0a.02]
MINQPCTSKIVGAGAFVPEQTVTSDELMTELKIDQIGIPTAFFERSTGIVERRWSDEPCTNMAIKASQSALVDANIDPVDIDAVIYCGIHPVRSEPATSHEVQRAIGARNATSFDISNACMGLLNGLSLADCYISAGAASNILVCAGEQPSLVSLDVMRQLKKSLSRENFRRLMGAFTVGDGGGAFVVSREGYGPQFRKMQFRSYAELSDQCYVTTGEDFIEFEMQMEAISKAMVAAHQEMIATTYSGLAWTPNDISTLFCHQVGARPHRRMVEMSGVNKNKAPITYERFGNLTSVTFAINYVANKPSRGDKLLFCGAGSGLSVCQIGLEF